MMSEGIAALVMGVGRSRGGRRREGVCGEDKAKKVKAEAERWGVLIPLGQRRLRNTHSALRALLPGFFRSSYFVFDFQKVPSATISPKHRVVAGGVKLNC